MSLVHSQDCFLLQIRQGFSLGNALCNFEEFKQIQERIGSEDVAIEMVFEIVSLFSIIISSSLHPASKVERGLFVGLEFVVTSIAKGLADLSARVDEGVLVLSQLVNL